MNKKLNYLNALNITKLRGDIENIIESMWVSANNRDKRPQEFSELKEKYDLLRKNMSEMGIPKEDIENYDLRVKNLGELNRGRNNITYI